MQKKLIQRSLALTAATALGLGSAFFAAPAMADETTTLDVQSQEKVEEAFKDLEGVTAYGESNGKLYLGAEKKTDELEALAKEYENVVIEYGIKGVEAYAANDIVGGAGYLIKADGEGGVCSTGFPGYDDSGNPVVLTAGHCAQLTNDETGEPAGKTVPDQTERPSTAEANGGDGFDPSGLGVVGSWGYTSFASGGLADDPRNPNQAKESDIDFAVLNVDKANYQGKNGVTDWTTADSDDLSTSLATEIKQVGPHKDGKIKKSGRTTGLTEGDVVPRDAYPYDYMAVSGYWVHGFAVTAPASDPFSQPGDSGGAVFQGDTAVGVISGGLVDEDGSFAWVADLDHSLEQSGAEFNLEDPTQVEAPDAPVVEDQTIKPNGDVVGKATPGADVKVEWNPTQGAQADPAGSETVKADDNGDFKLEGPEPVGVYDYTATAVVDGQSSDATAFKVTVEEEETPTPPPAERTIAIDPTEIPASDFVKEDKGVKVTVKGFDEGETVTLVVESGPKNVKGIELTETANADGVADFGIYGTNSSDPSLYIGKYDVSVTGANDTEDEDPLTGSFQVVADEDGSGGGSGGGDLPRTGAELTGLAAGAVLLLVGGTAVVLTMRRTNKK